MAKFLKGQDVKLMVGTDTTLLEKETNCSLSFNVNTVDASSKTDADPEYENADWDNTELSASAEGNVGSTDEIKRLIRAAIGTEQTYTVSAVLGTDETAGTLSKTDITMNDACMTSLEIDMPADGLATVSVNVECGSDFTIE